MPATNPHQNFLLLEAYGLGKVSPSTAETVAEHLETCHDCRSFVAQAPADDFLKGLREAVASPRTAVEVAVPRTVAKAPAGSEPIPQALLNSSEYEVVRELGRGGMGLVYLVRDRRMDRLEGLKLVKTDRLQRPGAVERFEREMRAAARLNHQNIVKAYSSPRLDGLLALAMEYVDGVDLQKAVKTFGPLPVANACYYVHQAALGLQHAHERHMVHRDIKPNNLILTRQGRKQVIKILDFGLAKATSEHSLDGGLTGTGQILGTPHYMAPEQILNASSADIRADIYSLGCTLYFLLSGKPPFKSKSSVYDVLEAQLQEEPLPLNRLRPEAPADLAATLGKMLAKSSAERYQEPREVAEALTPYFKNGVKPFPPRVAPTVPSPTPAEPELTQTESTAAKETNVGNAPGRPVEVAAAAPNAALAADAPGTVFEQIAELADAPAILQARDRRWNGGRAARFGKWQNWLVPCAALVGMAFLGLWVGGAFDGRVERPGTREGSKSEEQSVPVEQPALLMAPFTAEEAHGAQGAWAKSLQVKPVEENSIGMKLTLIPPGEFLMGNSRPGGNMAEYPLHRVRITQPFYLGTCEVTVRQYRQFADATGYRTLAERDPNGGLSYAHLKYDRRFNWRTPGFEQSDESPVTIVNWYDAVAFCDWLSKKEGITYRLPAEAEWEYACRAGTTTDFHNGDNADRRTEVGNVRDATAKAEWSDHGCASSDGYAFTSPAGTFQPNGFGLYDTLGNVWEWCADWRADGYYATSPADDPSGPATGTSRVPRGGSWFDDAWFCRSACRGWDAEPLSVRASNLGFRVARNLSPDKPPTAAPALPSAADIENK